MNAEAHAKDTWTVAQAKAKLSEVIVTMKLNEIVRGLRRYVEVFDYALEYDPVADLAARVQRLERQVADLNSARSA